MPFVAAAKALLAQGRPPETMLVAHHRGSRIVALRATLAVAAAWKPSVLVPKPSIERLASYASMAEADADREHLIVARDALRIAKNTLGLDECGLWCLQGSRGRITTWGEGEWLLFSTTHERTVREWRFIVRQLEPFVTMTQNCETEGAGRFQLPLTDEQASYLRGVLGLTQTREPSEAQRMALRSQWRTRSVEDA